MKLLSDKSAKEDFQFKAKHKNPEGGLSEAGRKAYNRATGGELKRPQPEGGSRRDSFCARMKGMKEKLTSAETARDPDSRINKSLRKWKCSSDMTETKEAIQPKEEAEQLKSRLLAAIKTHGGKILGATPYYTTNIESGIYFRDKNNKLKVSSPDYLPGYEIQEVEDEVFEPEELSENLDDAIASYIEAEKKENATYQDNVKLLSAPKEAKAKSKGLWANIQAKRKRGETPAKPGDADFPDAKSWNKVTQESEKEAAGRCWKGYEPVPGVKARTKGSCRPISTGKKKTEKKAEESDMAAKIMNIQQFMGQNPRRELREEEAKAVEKRKNSLLPAIFPNYSDSPAVKMYSPILPSLGAGLGGAGVGALLGSVLAGSKNREIGAAGGAVSLGGALALIAYLKRQQENANIEEIMRRLPRGATLRDYEADPLIQKNKDRKAQIAMTAAMMRR